MYAARSTDDPSRASNQGKPAKNPPSTAAPGSRRTQAIRKATNRAHQLRPYRKAGSALRESGSAIQAMLRPWLTTQIASNATQGTARSKRR